MLSIIGEQFRPCRRNRSPCFQMTHHLHHYLSEGIDCFLKACWMKYVCVRQPKEAEERFLLFCHSMLQPIAAVVPANHLNLLQFTYRFWYIYIVHSCLKSQHCFFKKIVDTLPDNQGDKFYEDFCGKCSHRMGSHTV